MVRDHQLLVGRHDKDRKATVALRYQLCSRRICGRIERTPQPSQLFGNPRARARRVFTDSSGEHEAIDTPESAHMEAPLPRWGTMTRPAAISGATCGRRLAMYS